MTHTEETGWKAWRSAIVKISQEVAWFPILIFFIHEVAARIFNLYGKWPPFDIPMHFLGGVSIAYFIAGSIRILIRRQLITLEDPLVHTVLVLSLTCVAAVFWEFAEWTSDRLINTSCQLSLEDTLADMLIGLIGGGAYMAHFILRHKAWCPRDMLASVAVDSE